MPLGESQGASWATTANTHPNLNICQRSAHSSCTHGFKGGNKSWSDPEDQNRNTFYFWQTLCDTRHCVRHLNEMVKMYNSPRRKKKREERSAAGKQWFDCHVPVLNRVKQGNKYEFNLPQYQKNSKIYVSIICLKKLSELQKATLKFL